LPDLHRRLQQAAIVDDRVFHLLRRFLALLGNWKLHVVIGLKNLRRADRHEEDEQHQQNVDHRRDLKLRIFLRRLAGRLFGCLAST